MGIETRPGELRDFRDPSKIRRMLEMSPDIQQEVIRFILSFRAICDRHDKQETVDSLNFLQQFFIKNYSDFLRPQPVYTEQRAISEYKPSERLGEVLSGQREISVPERLLEKNPEVKRAGLELLLSFWKIYENNVSDTVISEVLENLKVVIVRYLTMYPESIESKQDDFSKLKKEVLGEILGDPELTKILQNKGKYAAR